MVTSLSPDSASVVPTITLVNASGVERIRR
jgi:hypothetical protein